jgi:hypothetical protein
MTMTETPAAIAVSPTTGVTTVTHFSVDLKGHGQWIQPLSFPPNAVSKTSAVLASICELSPQGPTINNTRRMTIHNIVPDTGLIQFWLEVESSSDVNIRLQILVSND